MPNQAARCLAGGYLASIDTGGKLCRFVFFRCALRDQAAGSFFCGDLGCILAMGERSAAKHMNGQAAGHRGGDSAAGNGAIMDRGLALHQQGQDRSLCIAMHGYLGKREVLHGSGAGKGIKQSGTRAALRKVRDSMPFAV